MSVQVQFANGSIHECQLIAQRKGILVVKFQGEVFNVLQSDCVRIR